MKTATTQRAQKTTIKSRLSWAGGLAALVAAAALAACGGGGDSSDGGGGGGVVPPPPPITLTGKLIDAAVGGVKFTSMPSGTTGMTGVGGEFKYVAGDTVQFAVGNILLGSVGGQETVTPKVIADATVNLPAGVSSTDVAQNLAIFLQSFDADGNPDNGITITAEVGAAAASVTLNFGQKPDDFSQDPSLTQLATDTGSTVVTADEANAHQTRSLMDQLAGSWLFKDGDDVAVVTFFTDGTYVLGDKTSDSDCASGVEWGRYALDPNAGTFQVTGDNYVDTDGNCGLREANQATQDISDIALSTDGDALTFKVREEGGSDSNGEDDFVLTRIAAASGVAGSWLLDQPVAEGEPIVAPYVLTLLEDGTFLLADIGEPELNPGSDSQPGIEYGKWTAGSDNSFTITQIITDTDGPDAGFSTGTATRKLVNGKIVITDEDGSVSLTRLPLTKVIDASDLFGTWYGAYLEQPDADPEQSTILMATFLKDGSYVFGDQASDPNCDADYGTADPDPSGDLDPDGMGSELGQWYLEAGLGRVYAGEVTVDSDGSCGLYNRNRPAGPSHEYGGFFRKLDTDTLELTYYEQQDGGTDETDDGSYQPDTFLFKRVKSVANSVVGSWTLVNADGSLDGVATFFPNGTLFEMDTDEKGGVQRERWSLNEAGTELTVHTDPNDEFCVDTIGPNSSCDQDNGADTPLTISFSDEGNTLTLTEKGGTESYTLHRIVAP